ncbi:MAG: PIG-L family deacetylase [Deltaproteobacteria bacterium]|nr:PIG-L family deacetylase [Deltaproteobacteria bacterium]
MAKKRILAIGSHPDDIEFGCGATLVSYAEQGHEIFILVMTKGDMGGKPGTRAVEQEEAARIIGIKDIYWGGLSDTKIVISSRVISDIEKVIEKVSPDMIFCHFPEDTHQDHRHLAQMTISATRYIRNVLFYEGPTTERFAPQVYVDIVPTLTTKVKALLAHKSQVARTNIEDVSIIEMAHSTANFRGVQGRVRYAEAFFAWRLFLDTGI